MTLRQEKFLSAYLETGNATKSAILAGYSAKQASSAGYLLLKNEKIRERIEAIMAEDRKTALMSRDERRAFWETIMTDASNKTADRLKASELLAKSYGDFDTDVIERERLKGLTPEELKAEKSHRHDGIIFEKDMAL